ncbi:hypothetical protein BCR32DRAFT_284439 [Anaeromyces robustus]|uniref:Uncharacterized protein n=1 Tax=Anaeromyces robustus TaxID=1754192 RepID=A0A1Y1WRN0_9FUNG|nr:hypothetical protein BCR32DRAFT_284439 [Anaeromyces robustus]|eukprot:ORX76187.1 hypothetical protein BCR32DRAFT_284439 [Anaeromyces robustus]
MANIFEFIDNICDFYGNIRQINVNEIIENDWITFNLVIHRCQNEDENETSEVIAKDVESEGSYIIIIINISADRIVNPPG